MKKPTNPSRLFRRDHAALDRLGVSEIPRPSDDELTSPHAEQTPDSSPEPRSTEHPSEHWYG